MWGIYRCWRRIILACVEKHLPRPKGMMYLKNFIEYILIPYKRISGEASMGKWAPGTYIISRWGVQNFTLKQTCNDNVKYINYIYAQGNDNGHPVRHWLVLDTSYTLKPVTNAWMDHRSRHWGWWYPVKEVDTPHSATRNLFFTPFACFLFKH